MIKPTSVHVASGSPISIGKVSAKNNWRLLTVPLEGNCLVGLERLGLAGFQTGFFLGGSNVYRDSSGSHRS